VIEDIEAFAADLRRARPVARQMGPAEMQDWIWLIRQPRVDLPAPATPSEIALLEKTASVDGGTSCRVSAWWPECLECGAEVTRGRGQFRGLCLPCHADAQPVARRWFASLIERWRKWSKRRFNAEAFGDGDPDPWQVTLYALHKSMLGFDTPEGQQGTPRAGLAERLGVSVSHLESALRGSESLDEDAKRALVREGAAIMAFWKDDDDDDEVDIEDLADEQDGGS
jgi:hypothetical protein